MYGARERWIRQHVVVRAHLPPEQVRFRSNSERVERTVNEPTGTCNPLPFSFTSVSTALRCDFRIALYARAFVARHISRTDRVFGQKKEKQTNKIKTTWFQRALPARVFARAFRRFPTNTRRDIISRRDPSGLAEIYLQETHLLDAPSLCAPARNEHCTWSSRTRVYCTRTRIVCARVVWRVTRFLGIPRRWRGIL